MPVSTSILEKRPPNVLKHFADKKVALVNGRAIYDMTKKAHFIVGAFNIRHLISVEGIARAAKDNDSVVIYEIAKSETSYCNLPPEEFARGVVDIVEKVGCDTPFAVHADHTTVTNTTPKEFESAKDIIVRSIKSGYTTVSIDASHNQNEDNLRITTELAKIVEKEGLGLEVEIGEIGGERGFSKPEEAEWFISNLVERGIHPDLLAINNGSIHGNYGPGFHEGIQLDLTKKIYETVKKWNVGIAQHGITGTPMEKIAKFADYGIYKGNVGTLWQNIFLGIKMDESSNAILDDKGEYIKLDDRGIPTELWKEMVAWGEETGNSGGNIKKANKPFKGKIANVAPRYKERINRDTCEWATKLFKALRSVGSGKKVVEYLERH
jgi:fructose/tagatose bisphosphate aldolase